MNFKTRLSTSLTIAMCLCAPLSIYAANAGGQENIPAAGDYSGGITNSQIHIDTDVAGSVYGGYTTTNSDVTANTVTMQSGTVTTNVYGSYTNGSGNISNNSVVISGGTVSGKVYGGWNAGTGGNSNHNTVTITGGTFTGVTVLGGYSASSTAEYNEVNIQNAALTSASGGESPRGSVLYNKLTFGNSSVTGNIYGGNANTSSNVFGDAIGNVVIADKLTSTGFITGGNSQLSAANENTVVFNNSSTTKTVFGGQGYSTAGNTVILNNSSANYVEGGYTGATTSTGNSVFINNSRIANGVYGGEGTTGSSSNTVVFKNSSAANVYGSYTAAGESSNNNVTFSNSTAATWLVGGYSAAGNANNNTITVDGNSTLANTWFVGGYAGRATDQAMNNTINISGNVDLTGAYVYGGFGSTEANMKGNTLNLSTQISALQVANFEYYNFSLADNVDTSKAMINITDPGNMSVKDSKFDITYISNKANIKKGGSILLFDKAGNADQAVFKSGSLQVGVARIYDYAISASAPGAYASILATINDIKLNPKTKSLSEGRVAAITMVNSGADLVAGSALDNAAQATDKFDSFAAANYGQLRVNSGSHVDVNGSSLLVGMSRNIKHSNDTTTIGAFLESGWGTYDSYNSFADGNISAKGNTNYYGIGLLARTNRTSGMYTEGSLRIGRISNTYNSADMVADGIANYDLTSTYYGLHLGIGKINKLSATTQLDIYGKYFWAHQTAASANVVGDDFQFDSMDSHRIRIGGRLNNTNKNVTRYIGLAYEYEFGSKANATTYGMDIAAPTSKGSTGILELGVKFKPSMDSKFGIDFGINGYTGKRQGISGNMKLNWGF